VFFLQEIDSNKAQTKGNKIFFIGVLQGEEVALGLAIYIII
jgi:hypothetical protein